MVIRELINEISKKLTDSGCDNSLFEAQLILCHVTGMSKTELILSYNQDASLYKTESFAITKRRTDHEPLQYILGTQEFMSLEFKVSENVLIPRSDTEILVEYVLDSSKGEINLLDIGTGTGCIPLSIAHYNKNAVVRGIDINEKALSLSRENADKLGLASRSDFIKLDILNEIPHGKFDIITSNPPYIESDVIPTLQKEVKDYEPHLALDGGCDGLTFYRRICNIAPKLLNPQGLLVFEIGYEQAESVKALMEKDFDNICVIRDLSGNDRVIAGRLKNN